jgi:hypothetical protein
MAEAKPPDLIYASPFREGRVARDDWSALGDRLGDEEPVEGVAVVERQGSLHVEMLRFQRKNLDGVRANVFAEQASERQGHLQLPDANLDRHLPQTTHAQETLIPSVFDGVPRIRAQPRVCRDEPQERVGVEEQLHDGMYPAKSSSGASKSSLILI